MGLEFLLDRHIRTSDNGGSTIPGDAESSPIEGQSGTGRQSLAVDEGDIPLATDAAKVASSSSADTDEEDEDTIIGGGGEGRRTEEGEEGATAGLQLRSEAPGATVLLRARRKIPVVGASGQPIMAVTPPPFSPTAAAATGTATPNGGPQHATQGDGGPTVPSAQNKNKTARQRESSGNLETTEAARVETRDMIVQVYWDGAAKDRAYVEAYPAKKGDREGGGTGDEGDQCLLLRLGVRVPTLAIVDAQAASKFAERVVQQVSIQMDDERVGARGKRGGGQRQQHGQTLRLGGVDAKSVVAGN